MSTHGATHRISKEVTGIQKGTDLSLAVAFQDEDVRNVRALIIGPPDTPYEFGFFEFSIHFGRDYPTKAPNVKCITTNGGRTRFNPNIYAEGKVCLSILGTWRGESGEEWSSAQGLESILISIQSLMSANPYENEPGFEDMKRENDKKDAKSYAAKIQHETLRIAVVKRLEGYLGIEGPLRKEGADETPPSTTTSQNAIPSYTNGIASTTGNHEHSTHSGILAVAAGLKGRFDSRDDLLQDEEAYEPFVDLSKRRFLWYYQAYLSAIDSAQTKHGRIVADGARFPLTAFECVSNGMDGSYEYSQLKTRLARIRSTIDAETESWVAAGAAAHAREHPTALMFNQKYKHAEHEVTSGGGGSGGSSNNSGDDDEDQNNSSDSSGGIQNGTFDMEREHSNPFVWLITIFGRPGTLLEGGIFTVRIVFPLSFPSEQPRATVQTPLFHQRVSPEGGVLCYFPRKPDDPLSHVLGAIEAVENEMPPYDPRTLVNPEAAALLWDQGEVGKREYNRRVRKSAERSLEAM